ncbi:MAG: Asp-tRNA(Asn)/Glu-tRNA(Gln) amidotransferase subunit GatC [Nanoarchaeota archaeon]|nr:Asp-tRNA(Asn)/Glu-tRNA(Gln) amidotransferase subunit GatC [Nanoarchaeota archaeon]
MKIDEQFIRKVASNARLELSDKEIKKFIPQFKDILENFSKLDNVDVSKTELSVHPVELKNMLREDEEKECLSQKDALRNAFHKKEGYFRGPKAV